MLETPLRKEVFFGVSGISQATNSSPMASVDWSAISAHTVYFSSSLGLAM